MGGDAIIYPAFCVAMIAAMMRRGVAGVSPISTPKGRSASLIALTMAAGGAMALPSPTPLMP